MSRAQFESYYAREQLPCLSSVKERHWQTWLEAQATLLSAHGPVTMLTVIPVDEYAEFPAVSWGQLNASKTAIADESYSKGWKDCMASHKEEE